LCAPRLCSFWELASPVELNSGIAWLTCAGGSHDITQLARYFPKGNNEHLGTIKKQVEN
jgi:hypothetical protein